MLNFSKISTVLDELKKSQDAEDDVRQQAREAALFIYAKDGQWDPYIWQRLDGRFRGTFDMCTPVVDQIVGEIDQSDFTLNVRPASGDASQENAKLMSGLIRNIRNISNFDDGVLPKIARGNVVSGFDAFEIVQDYCDADTFDQDLFLRRIPNAVDTVWFDPNSSRQDRSDAMWAIKLTSYTKEAFENQFGEDEQFQGVESNEKALAFYNKADTILVGQIYYKKPVDIELVKMSDGKVYRVDDDFEAVQDELAQLSITEIDRRKRKSYEVKSRIFSGNDWLTEEESTVFNELPIIPVYGNFEVIENKPVFFGKVEKLMDHQRVLNYAISRDVEDGSLSPKPSIWMTPTMAAGHDYSTMNTDNDPIRFFNTDGDNPALTPVYTGGPQASQGLQTTIANMQQMFQVSSNTFDAGVGNANSQQSGIAGLQQIEAGNTGNIKWFKSLQIALTQAGRVLVDAIPKVYDSTRQARILEEDGTTQISPINTNIIDQQSGQIITLHDLSKGEYDVVCDFGPAFKTQQEKTAQAFLDLAQLDPSIAQMGKDILIKQINTPGMEQLRERVREQMLNDGIIPESQWTEDEQAKVAAAQQAAAQQPQEPSPEMVLAQAEMVKGQAEKQNADLKQFELQSRNQLEQLKLQLEQTKLELENKRIELDLAKFDREKSDKYNKDLIDASQNQQKIDLQSQSQAFEQMMKVQQAQSQQLTEAINGLKTLREAMGVDAIVSQNGAESYQEQQDIIDDAQEKLD